MTRPATIIRMERERRVMARRSTTVVRFGRTERIYHWVQAIPYLVLLVTGGWLLLMRLGGADRSAEVALVWTHRVSGVLLPVAMLLTFLAGDSRVLLRNGATALRWSWADVRWLFLVPLAALWSGVRLPPSGKFNPGQKIHFLVLMVLLPVFMITGLWIWLLPGALLPWFAHVAALSISLPLLLGHLYLALVSPVTRQSMSGIFTGRVDARWAREHHPLEYRDPADGSP